jgi:hypothetical protein
MLKNIIDLGKTVLSHVLSFAKNIRKLLTIKMAEPEGFEPSVRV